MRRLIPAVLVIVVLVCVFPFIYGCSDDSDASNTFNELLKLVPSDVDTSQTPLALCGYAALYEDYDISLTGGDGQPLTYWEFYDLVQEKEIQWEWTNIPWGSDAFITGRGLYGSSGTIEDKYVGYNFTDVDAEIQAGTYPLRLTAAIGRFDARATRDALSRQDEWPAWAVDAYAVEEYNGVTVHSWGDGYEVHLDIRLVPPLIDHLGRAMPLAVTDEYLFYGPSLEAVKSMIDASRGEAESLAELPEYAGVADELYEHNAYSAFIGSEAIANGALDDEGTYPGPMLEKFVTFGLASGRDENGTYVVLAIYHESSGDARANASLLEERIAGTDSIIYEIPWSEIITATDISADGNLLVARLYTENLGIGSILVYGGEPLLIHEQ